MNEETQENGTGCVMIAESSEAVTKEEITTEFHSKKAEVEVKLSKEELEAIHDKRRHEEFLASMNRKQRRAYLSGRRAGLS